MCGIAGILDPEGLRSGRFGELERMTRALRHRGPDAQACWWNSSQRVGLGHSRLAIIEPGEAGAQPMRSGCGRYVITFNGEIYNHESLRQWLLERGVSLRSHCDTEVLLELFRVEGAAMLSRLKGMYAFCLWDEWTQSALLARDVPGIKPLFYAQHQGALIFASELRALLSCEGLGGRLDAAALEDLLALGSIAEPRTLHEGVSLLQAGEHLWWRDSGLTLGRHAPPQQEAFEGSRQEAVALVRAGLMDSVQRHLVSDVPLGLLLSGGMDSTAILALAREVQSGGLDCFCVALPGHNGDESDLARRTASHFAARRHTLPLDRALALECFEEFLQSIDQPGVDGFNVFVICRLIAREGFKVALSGLGGDECFGGYPSFELVPRLLRWHRWFGGGLWQHWHQLPLRGRWRRLAAFLSAPASVAAAHAAVRQLRARRDAAHLVRAMLGRGADGGPLPQEPSGDSLAEQIAALESVGYLRNQLLRDADVFSMAHGVELRVPLVDATLSATLQRLPPSLRFAPGKGLMAEAVPEIPPWVLRGRSRRGFLFPYEQWLRGAWGQRLASASVGAPLRQESWYQQWTLFVLREVLVRRGLMASGESLFSGGLRS